MKNWYIAITEENCSELLEWWNGSEGKSTGCRPPLVGEYLMSKNPKDNSCYWAKSDTDSYGLNWQQEYELITLEQFRQIINSKPMSNTEVKTIQISRTLLNEYFDAATMSQQEYLTKHFKLDGTTTDEAIRGLCELACNTWKPKIKANHPECFPKESKYFDFSKHTNLHGCDSIVLGNVADSLGLCRNFIQVRFGSLENNDRSFYLTGDYNWELINEGGDMVLIPTKKVK
jgi:hypothetical protein